MIDVKKSFWSLLLIGLSGCGQQTPPVSESEADEPQTIQVTGTWRAVLASPGGELPFTLQIDQIGDQLNAVAVNGSERIEFSDVVRNDKQIEFQLDWYDSEILAELSDDGSIMRGRWRKTAAGAIDSSLPFSASRGVASRFLPSTHLAPGFDVVADVDGVWQAEFTDEDGDEIARAEFSQSRDTVTGTFLTPTGDYRYLEGSYDKGLLRLSAFDGAHVFLFVAEAQQDGSLVGDFWSRETYHATWVATRAEPTAKILPDSWSMVKLTNDDQEFDFSFEAITGETVSLADPRFAGKAMLVNLFGTWCPNCNDEAPLLAQWHRDYRDRGLEIVGLGFEFTGDIDRDREMIGRFKTRHGIEYPLLLAGINDKQSAADALMGYLDKVVAYPTTIFLDRDHKVQAIHSGFNGPGTGAHHTVLVAELQAKVESLLE